MAYNLTIGTLNALKSNGISTYINDVLVTAAVTVSVGQTIKLVVGRGTFDNVYFFDPIMEETYYFSLNGAYTEATLNLPSGSSMSLYYNGTFPEVTYTYTTSDIADWAASNFEMKINGTTVPNSDGFVALGDVVTLVGINNYVFVYARFYASIQDDFLNFTLSSNRDTATITLTTEDSYTLQYSTEIGAPLAVRGSNSVYSIADADLSQITESRFVVEGAMGGTVDYGKFILGLLKLPFSIDPALIVGNEPVKLGPVNTGVTGGLLSVDKVTYSLGSITVAGVTDNAFDYAETSTYLHLPYTSPVQIDVDYVIDQTVTVDLVINLYDGSADYNLSSTKIGGVFNTVKVQLDVNIPFSNVEGVPSRNNPSNIDMGVDNGIKTAFIEVLRKNPVLPDGEFTTSVADESAIGDQTGYVVVEDVKLNVSATTRERDMIESALKGGVFLP